MLVAGVVVLGPWALAIAALVRANRAIAEANRAWAEASRASLEAAEAWKVAARAGGGRPSEPVPPPSWRGSSTTTQEQWLRGPPDFT